MSKRKVVLTGASGKIAGQLLPFLRERYDLTLLDIKSTDREDVHICDLLEKDRGKYRHFFRGAHAVIHSGWVRGNRDDVDDYFDAEYANIRMAYNVYQVALEENVQRVVVMSSNHAADYYERLIFDKKWDYVTTDMKARSDNYYGWAKDVYEHLGFVFACGQETGKPLENVQIRIGGPREDDLERAELGDLRRVRRGLAVYLSERDMAQLFIKSIEAEDIRDEFGVPFQVFYGISDNSHAFWSIANARRIIGYEPEDNSEYKFHDLIQKHIQAATN